MKRDRSRLVLVLLAAAAVAAGCGAQPASGLAAASSAPPSGTTGAPSPTPHSSTAQQPPTLKPQASPTEQPPTPEPTEDTAQDMKVLGYGFTYEGGSTPVVSYAVVLENPNPSGWIGDVSINITFYAPDGSVAGTEDEEVRNALPGKVAVGGDSFPDAKVAKMDVVLDTQWTAVDFAIGAFDISRAKTRSDGYSTSTTGLITSTFKEDQEYVTVVAVYRNASGRIVGGARDIVDKVKASASVSFKASAVIVVPHVAKTEVYAY